MSLTAGKSFVLLSVGEETEVSNIRITASVYKVSMKINPFLLDLILPSKANPAEQYILYISL